MKLIFIFDLDGTIIIDNKKLDKIIENKIEDIIKSGHKIYFASARSIRGIRSVLPKTFFSELFILCNGAFVYDKGKIVVSNPIKSDTVLEIVRYLEEAKIQFYLEFGKSIYIPPYKKHHTFYDILLEEAKGEIIYDSLKGVNTPTYKITILDKIISPVKDCIDKYNDELHIYQYTDGSTDIVSSKASKWKALNQILVDRGCNIVAFGNDENDEEMIKKSNYGVVVCSTNEMLDRWAKIRINTYNPYEIVAAVDKALRYYESHL